MLLNKKKLTPSQLAGMTLVEVLVATALFVLLLVAVYQAFVSVQMSVQLSRRLAGATTLASDQMEIIRNLPYTAVEPQTQQATNAGFNFSVVTTVQTVNDSYKLVTVQVDPVILYTYIAQWKVLLWLRQCLS